MLGPARVFIDGKAADHPASRRARVRQLLTLLAVERNLRRDRAMMLLWPDLDQTAASRNLRVTLTYLRQVLRGEEDGRTASGLAPDERFLIVDSSAIRLIAHPGLDVDLWQLDSQLTAAAQARAVGDARTHASALAAAAALWQGEPLADLQDFEELSGELTRVRTALVDATLALGEVRLSEGKAADSVRSAQAVLAADGYNERAHRLAIATQIQLGDHAAASEAARRLMRRSPRSARSPRQRRRSCSRRIATFGALASTALANALGGRSAVDGWNCRDHTPEGKPSHAHRTHRHPGSDRQLPRHAREHGDLGRHRRRSRTGTCSLRVRTAPLP